MGQFSLKNDDIEKEEGENDYLKFSTFNIQGWRKQNYNTFISRLSQGNKNNFDIFCIFDGHNGSEVSQFVKNHFDIELISNINKYSTQIKDSIKNTFLKMNELMQTIDGKNEIKQLKIANLKEENKKYEKILNENQIEDEINLTEEEVKDIVDYTGCTSILILIDEKNKKLYFGNIGNSEAIIYGNNTTKKILASKHRVTEQKEKERIKRENGLILNDKLYGIFNFTRAFGDLAYIIGNEFSIIPDKLIRDEPDIYEYYINDDDEYIFIGTESIIESIDKNNFEEIKNIEENLKDKITYEFYNNDTDVGFDSITCTLIKIKK